MLCYYRRWKYYNFSRRYGHTVIAYNGIHSVWVNSDGNVNGGSITSQVQLPKFYKDKWSI